MNPKAPKNVWELDTEEVWDMCVFAAKKCGMAPEDFWEEFINEGAEEIDKADQEWKTLDYYEMQRAALQKLETSGFISL